MLNSLGYSLLFAPNVLVALVVVAVFLLLIRKHKTAIFCLLVGLGWVLLWSLPAVTVVTGSWLESRYAQRQAATYPQVQAIVVLGGHIQGNRRNWFEPYDRDKVISRESLAADLYATNRAPLILLSGGALVGDISDTANMARYLQNNGVPAEAILQETESQSTLENAELTRRTLQRLDVDRILLVTSALHMPRAMAAFDNTGIAVTAAPLPPQIELPPDSVQHPWSPDLHTLLASRSIIKEYAGLLIYWLSGVKNALI
ncbi:MAG: YdcF family protein [Burkholderiaceae bacterium]|nr:YdcF family protein [Burkholderiaceae bacterium]MCD8515904.1 YdcF family protein [Burkholderiaceae bacterium]MCD8538155.1 YdcF family protein [Burkholderiaceae bacterium]MCD8565813.1 YdcF family protein [Burkholderiaceae bacterium]